MTALSTIFASAAGRLVGLSVLSWGLASGAQAQALTVTGLSPARNALSVPRSVPVAVSFNQPLRNASSTTGALHVFSQQAGGQKTGTTTVSGNTLTFQSASPFRPGETVQATLSASAQSSAGLAAMPQVFQFITATVPSTPVFTSGSEVAVGDKALAVVVGDVDNDGDLDMLTAIAPTYPSPTKLSVRLNDGAGNFSQGAEFSLGDNIFFVGGTLKLGDIDGDGDLDVLLSGLLAQELVYTELNDGKGNFSRGTPIPVYAGVSNLLLGDLDGDGDLDLVTMHPIPGVVGIRFNAGNGTFSGGQDTRLGPSSVTTETLYTSALGDIDGDGDLDILVDPIYYATAYTLLNKGDGTFSLQSQPGLAGLLGDVDGDGDLDLVGVTLGGVRLNKGDGSFAEAQQLDVKAAALGDIDGDGDLDIVDGLVATANSTVSVRINNGRGIFAAATPLAIVSGIGGNEYAEAVGKQFALGDVDDDGTLDLLTASGQLVGVSVRLNQARLPVIAASTRLRAGSTPLATSRGVFAADQYYSAASLVGSTTATIVGTPDPALYQSERYSTNGTLSYALPVANGQYTVVLHFAELYWTQPGQRVFDGYLEGAKVLDHYDIVQRVGPLAAITETFTVTVTDGVLNLDLRVPYGSGGADQAKLAALEVLRVGSSAAAATSSLRTAPASLLSAAASLSTYPNPSAGAFTLAYSTETPQAATLLLTDPLGRVLHQQAVALQAGDNQVAVRDTTAPAGLYRLTLRLANGHSQSRQVLIQP